MPESTRKLAAIVFTDIVGFTKLSAGNEPAALSLLEKQRELLKPIVEKHGGSWLKEIGDGLLLSFETTKDAVDCAIEIQKIVKEVENLNLRIGIHQGEVVFQGSDVIGDDVNIAARIEPFAAPGGVAISGRVNASLERDPDFETHYLGQPQLKGVSQTVKAYCITSHGLPKTDMSKVSAKLEPEGFQWNVKNTIGIAASMIGLFMLINFMFLRIGFADEEEVPSIAILPFENKGADEDDFFAYGISSDLIADVTGTGMIRVAGLNDIERLDYGSMSYNDLSDELLVRYVAKGTLWKMDTMFQLSMELFDTKNSEVVWSNRWQTAWKDLAIIKDDLADKILDNLNINIIKNSEQGAVATSPEAYEYYLKGKYKFEKRVTAEDLEIAQGLFQKAVDLDSSMIMARVFYSRTYAFQNNFDRSRELLNSLLTYSEQANNKEGIAYALYGIGTIMFFSGEESDNVMEYYERAIKIVEEINFIELKTRLLTNMGVIYQQNGDREKSLANMEKVLEIAEKMDDKATQSFILRNLGYFYQDDDPDRAHEYFKRALSLAEEIGSNTRIAMILDALAYYNLYRVKDYNKAMEYAKRALGIFKTLGDKFGEHSSLQKIGNIYANLEDYKQSLDYYNQAYELMKDDINKAYTIEAFFGLSETYVQLKDYDKALDYLTQAMMMSEEIADNNFKARTFFYQGNLYATMGDYDSAIEMANSGKSLSEEIVNKLALADMLALLGEIHDLKRGETDIGLDYYNQVLELIKEVNPPKDFIANNLISIGWVYSTKGEYKIAAEQYLEKALEIKKEIGDDLGLWGSLCLYLSYKHLGRDYDVAHIKKLIDEENNIDFETNYMIYQLLGERSHLKTAFDQVKEREDVLDTKLREKFYNYPTPKAIIEEWEKVQS